MLDFQPQLSSPLGLIACRQSMMDIHRWPAFVAAVAIFLHTLEKAEAVNCYVCSWNPQDKDLEQDRCSSGNFDEHRVRYINCYLGCEVVKILDSNGELLMFYRNCLMASPNKLDYDRSHKKKTVMTEEEMYACDSDLCNSAFRRGHTALLLLTTVFGLSRIIAPAFP